MLAEAICTRIAYSFAPEQDRNENTIVQPWSYYPKLFEDSLHWIRLLESDLQEGYLIEGNEGEGNQIHLPKLKDSKGFVERMFEGLS